MTEEQIEWVPMNEAAKRVGISPSKLSRLVARGKVQTEINPYDEREKLVNMQQLVTMFPQNKRHK